MPRAGHSCLLQQLSRFFTLKLREVKGKKKIYVWNSQPSPKSGLLLMFRRVNHWKVNTLLYHKRDAVKMPREVNPSRLKWEKMKPVIYCTSFPCLPPSPFVYQGKMLSLGWQVLDYCSVKWPQQPFSALIQWGLGWKCPPSSSSRASSDAQLSA